MNVVEISGPQACRVVQRPDPRVGDNFALVKVLAAPMCTEFHAYQRGEVGDVLGHEAAGEVVAVGPKARVEVGQRMVVMPQNGCGRCALCLSGEHIRCQSPRDPLAVCGSETGRATYAQFLIQQDWLLLPIPDDVSTLHASMACCGLGPTFAAMEAMSVDALDTVLVSGLGPVGLGAVVNGILRGARVIGLEVNPYRAHLAKELGAEAVVDPASPEALEQIQVLTNGVGADKSIEASSQPDAPAFLLQATRRGGAMASVGWGGPVAMRDLVARGVTLHGIWHWNHLRYADRMFTTIRHAGPLLDRLITHRFPLSKVQEAWELQLTGRCGKVVLEPWA